MATQNYSNHTRLVPGFHFVLAGILFLTLIGSLINLYKSWGIHGQFDSAALIVVLVIWGEKDTALLTGNLNGLDEHVKNLTVRRIPDGTHWVIHEKTAEVIQDVRDFLAR